MTLRRDTAIEVDTKPDSREIRLIYPMVKELAIYWSVCKSKWIVSCRCTEDEANGIKEMYSDKCKPVRISEDEMYVYDKWSDSWSLSKSRTNML